MALKSCWQIHGLWDKGFQNITEDECDEATCCGSWVFFWPAVLFAGPTQKILDYYAEAAREDDPAFDGFSAERGDKLYHEKGIIRGPGFVTCASCHLPDPREVIIAHQSRILCRACHVINDQEHSNPKKAKVRKISPLAPSENAKRLTDPQTVEDFLRVNCTLVFKSECTAKEKGDVLVWLGGIK